MKNTAASADALAVVLSARHQSTDLIHYLCMETQELIDAAYVVYGPRTLSKKASAGQVASALVTDHGNVYTGVCFDAACGLGHCAEHAALSKMLTHQESRVAKIVAVDKRGILPPCGKCRELLYQIDFNNAETEIVVDRDKALQLRDLLPEYWQLRSIDT